MGRRSRTSGPPRTLGDEEWFAALDDAERRATLDWMAENVRGMRRSAYGQRVLYWILGLSLVVGLAVYAAGYAVKSSVTTEPLRFVGDLLYALGWALWTGVVVAFFLQVVPQVKRRQYQQVLDAYEATLRENARVGDEATQRRDERLLAEFEAAARVDPGGEDAAGP